MGRAHSWTRKRKAGLNPNRTARAHSRAHRSKPSPSPPPTPAAAAGPLLRRGLLLYTTEYAPTLLSPTPAPFLHTYAVACSCGSPSERRRRASRAAARVPVRGVPPCARVHRPPCFYRRYCVRTVGSICWAGLGVFSQLCC